MLLTQIQSGKTKTEKANENQLKGAPSIKDLQIAERLEHLKQYNKRNKNDNNDDDHGHNISLLPAPPIFDLLLHHLPLPSFDSNDDSDIEEENPIQKFLLGDRPQKEKLQPAEKTALKKVRFLENLNELFPKADEIFDNQTIDDDLPEITIPNTQIMFKELNNRKIPEELKLLGGSGGRNYSGNEFKFHAMPNMGMLNESNNHFLDYLSSDFTRKVLSKNNMKIHLDTGNIYYNSLNMRESIYSF